MGGCLSIVLVGGLLLWLSTKIGAWVWLIAVVILMVVRSHNAANSRRVSEEKNRERLEAPCPHGISGARLDPSRCDRCQQDIQHRKEAEEHLKAQQERERLALRQREFDAWKAQVRLPEYLRSMDPRKFETLVCMLFERMGYSSEQTPYVGDGGVDGYLRRDGNLLLLQCKRVKGSVGEPVLRDLFGNINARGADEGIVVTTGKVSRQAKAWAKDKPIRIIELEELTELLRTYFDDSTVVPESFQVTSEFETDLYMCPKCGRKLRTVKGRRGRFLGCSGYPECHFTRRLPTRRSR